MRLDTLGTLLNIRDAARYIIEDTAGATFEEILNDRRMRQLVERNLMVIGEAVNRLRRRDPATADRITAVQSLPILRHEVEELLPEEDREGYTAERERR